MRSKEAEETEIRRGESGGKMRGIGDNGGTLSVSSGDEVKRMRIGGKKKALIRNAEDEATLMRNGGNEETLMRSGGNEETLMRSGGNEETLMRSGGNEETLMRSAGN